MWALGAALLLLAVLSAGSWYVIRTYGPTLTRDRLERALADALDRPARVERVSLQPWLGRLSVRGVEIAAGPTWQAGTLARVGRITIGVGISSLWRRELVLSRMSFEDVDVRATAEGGDGPVALPAWIPVSVDLGPLTVRIGEVALERARIEYRDPRAGHAVTVEGLSATAAPVEGGLDASASAVEVRARGADVDATITGVSASGRLRGDRLALARLQFTWRGQEIRASGEARDLATAPTVALDVRGKASLAAVAELARADLVVTGVAAFEGSVKGPLREPEASGRASVPEMTARGVTARRVSAELAWRDRRLTLSNVRARVFEGELRGGLLLVPARPGEGRLAVQAEHISLAALEPLLERSLGARGHVSGTAELRGDLRRPLEAEGQVQVRSSDLTLPTELARLGAGAVEAQGRLATGGAEVLQAEGRWPGLRVTDVRGTVRPEGPVGLRAIVSGDTGRVARAWGENRVAGEATVAVDLGGRWRDLTASGRVRSPRLDVAGVSLTAVDLPFRLSDRTLTFKTAAATLGQSRVEGSGTLGWTGEGSLEASALRERLQLDADLAARSARLEDFAAWVPPDWPATGGFDLTAHVVGTLAAWRASGTVGGRDLTLRGEPIERVSARFSVNGAGVEVPEVSGSVRGIPVEARGAWRWDGEGRVRADIGPAPLARVPGIPDAIPLEGTARASADLMRRAGAWSGTATARGAEITIAGLALHRGEAELALANDALTATFAFPDARISGRASGRLAAGQELAVRVALSDFDLAPLARRIPGLAENAPLRGQASGTAELSVPYSRPVAARGTLTVDPLRLVVAGEEWRNRGPVLIRREAEVTRLERVELASPLGALTTTGSIGDGGRLEVSTRGRFPLAALAAFRSEIQEATGTLDVDANVNGTVTTPIVTGDGSLQATRVVFAGFPEPLTDVRARFTATRDRVRIADATGTLAGGELRASGTVGLTPPARLDLRISGRLPLAAVAALRPEVREVAGFADVNVTVAGTMADPQAAGEGTIRDARLTLRDYPEALRDVQARFTVSPAGVRLTRASASFAGGQLAVTGDLALKGRHVGSYRFDIEARRVGLAPVEGLQTTWDATLELVGFEDRSQLRGEARLLRGTYVSELPLLRLLLEPRRAGSGGVTGPGLPLDVRVRLDDNLAVRTTLARFRAGGALTLQGTTAEPILFGTLETTEGQLVFRKQRFTITAAAAHFTDPRRVDPILDVQARARIQIYDVTMTVSGRSDDLQIRLASNPSLPEEDILTLIAFGSTREQLAKGGAEGVAGEVAGLIVQDLFGVRTGDGMGPVDIFEMQTTEAEGRRVRVGKRITSRATVLYSQGIENTDERRLRLEYEVVGPLVVAGEQNFRGGYGADVLLRLRFR